MVVLGRKPPRLSTYIHSRKFFGGGKARNGGFLITNYEPP